MTKTSFQDMKATAVVANAIDLVTYTILEVVGNDISSKIGVSVLTIDMIQTLVANNIAAELASAAQ